MATRNSGSQFSFWRVVGLLSLSFEILIIAGSVVKLLLAFSSSLQGELRLVFDALYNVVILSALVFILIQFWTIFGIGVVVYSDLRGAFSTLLVAGWGLLSASA
jgi:hypothetical protein